MSNYGIDNRYLVKIIDHLQNDGLLIIPTETVYGLAGNTLSTKAIKKIFDYKVILSCNCISDKFYSLLS